MLVRLSAVLVAVFVLSVNVGSAQAQNRCPAGNLGCNAENTDNAERIRDRVNEGARRVWTNPSGNGRLKETRDMLKDCIECGVDTLKTFSGSSSARGAQ